MWELGGTGEVQRRGFALRALLGSACAASLIHPLTRERVLAQLLFPVALRQPPSLGRQMQVLPEAHEGQAVGGQLLPVGQLADAGVPAGRQDVG